ncbi:MAG TPA: integrase [Rugosimonospora sp.]
MRPRLRKLHTDGHTYAWKADIRHVSGNGDCHRCIRLRIWGNGKNGRALQVDLLSKSYPGIWGTACAADDVHPGPADVRTVIRYALKRGWDPAASGGTFALSETGDGAAFELPGFLITDRLMTPEAPDPTVRVELAFQHLATSSSPG